MLSEAGRKRRRGGIATEETDALRAPEAEAQSATRFAVIDLASAKTLQPLVTRADQSVSVPLFAWSMPQPVLDVGPWLVSLSGAPHIDTAISRLNASDPWGFFVLSKVDITSLRLSLRRFNKVEIPSAPNGVLFRYWDPRIMATFLAVATPAQRKSIFDRIERIRASDDRFDMSATEPKA